MTSRLWVLGAADTEMVAIETLLRAAGEQVAYATVDGVRVHPGNAYKADGSPLSPMGGYESAAAFDQVVLVECGGRFSDLPLKQVVLVDHHRPGDPGYGRPPEEFLLASSVGQAWMLLHPAGSGDDLCYSAAHNEWRVFGDDYDDNLVDSGLVPPELVMVAAADHCLEAAYRGRCPGVDPDALMRWRAESRAAFRRKGCAHCGGNGVDPEDGREVDQNPPCPRCGGTVEAVLADVEAARRLLALSIGAYGSWDLADLRGQKVPELPEAACREGTAYLATVQDRDGREKVVLGGAASPELVRRFQAGEVVPGLVEMYGDPARGFAGGYVAK